MVQTFTIDIAASICPPLTEQEVQDAIAMAVFAKEQTLGVGMVKVEVEQIYGTFAVGTAQYGRLT